MYIELFIAEKDMNNDFDNFNDDLTGREFVFDENHGKKSAKKLINSIEIQSANISETKGENDNNKNNQLLNDYSSEVKTKSI